MGRKKLIHNIQAPTENVVSDTVDEPKQKRRGKKQFPVIAKIGADGIIGSLMTQEIKPLIAHLPIHSAEVQFFDGPPTYDPTPPKQTESYDDTITYCVNIQNDEETTLDQSHFSFIDNTLPLPPLILPYEERELPQLNEPVAQQKAQQQQQQQKQQQNYQVNEPNVGYTSKVDKNKVLMMPFLNMKETRQLPDKTDIACFWCTYEFDHTPYVIPRFEENGIWYVYGNFCCPECAMAYLLEEKEDLHARWERIALIHRLYTPSANTRIYPAPPRAVLQRFGGQYTIEEYRGTISKKQIRIDINYPPMISLIGSIDTKPIDFYEPSSKGGNVILNTDMISRAEEGLRLKRTKPLKEKESTLDSCMNITVKMR